jgi:hypothetical protein
MEKKVDHLTAIVMRSARISGNWADRIRLPAQLFTIAT